MFDAVTAMERRSHIGRMSATGRKRPLAINVRNGWKTDIVLRFAIPMIWMMRQAVLFVAAALLAAPAHAQQHEMPVWDGNAPPPGSVTGYNCNVAVVTGLSGQGRLLVRSGPGPRYRVIGRLEAGATIFVCNEARGRRENGGRYWLGVAFAAEGKPCTGAAPEGLDIRRSVRCRTGWVSRDWVTIISG